MEKEEAPTHHPHHEVVDRWFAEHIPNSPAATTVEAWNYLLKARDELKRRLTQETK